MDVCQVQTSFLAKISNIAAKKNTAVSYAKQTGRCPFLNSSLKINLRFCSALSNPARQRLAELSKFKIHNQQFKITFFCGERR